MISREISFLSKKVYNKRNVVYMDNDKPDNNGGEGLDKGKGRALEGAYSDLTLRSLIDESHKILDPLYIQPNSGNAEDEILFEFSKTTWGNDKPIKFYQNAEVIVGTPCDPLGTTTVQTSDKIAAHNVSGIEKPSRGRFITFTADGPNRIIVELKNMNGRKIEESSCIKSDKSTGNFDEISKHLLGEPYPPVPFSDLPTKMDTFLKKRLDRHDELTLEELQTCIFDPKTTMLEGGTYKYGFVLDGEEVKMVYGRSMLSAAGKPLRPNLYHDHLTGNMEVLGAAGTFGIMPKKNLAIYCDNNSSGYDFPSPDDVKKCFKGLIHEGGLIFSSLNLEDVGHQADNVVSFRRPPGSSRNTSRKSSLSNIQPDRQLSTTSLNSGGISNPSTPSPPGDYFSSVKPPTQRQESASSYTSSASGFTSATPLSLGGAGSSRAPEVSESPQQSPPSPESPTMPGPIIEGRFAAAQRRRPLLRKITGSFQDVGLGRVSEVSVDPVQHRQSGDIPGRPKSPAANPGAEELMLETPAPLRIPEVARASPPRSSKTICDILRNGFKGKPRRVLSNVKGAYNDVKNDLKNVFRRGSY